MLMLSNSFTNLKTVENESLLDGVTLRIVRLLSRTPMNIWLSIVTRLRPGVIVTHWSNGVNAVFNTSEYVDLGSVC